MYLSLAMNDKEENEIRIVIKLKLSKYMIVLLT